MRILTVLFFALVCTSAKSDRYDQYTNVPAGEMDLPQFLEAVFTSDFVQNKIDNTLDLVDLNIHYIKLFKTLFTTENLILLRRTLEWLVSISNVVVQVLPDNPEKPITINTILNHIFYDEDENNNYIEDYVPQSSSVFATIVNLLQDRSQTNKNKYTSNVKDSYTVSHIVADKDQDYENIEDFYVHPKTDPQTTERSQEVFTSPEKTTTYYSTAAPTSSTTIPSTTTTFTSTTSTTPTTATPPTTTTTSTATTRKSVTLSDEDLKLLKSYGLSQEEAAILANHIFQKNNEVERYKRGGQQIQDRIVKRHGAEFSKALTVSQLVRGPQYRHN